MKSRLIVFLLLGSIALSTNAQVIMQPAEPNAACTEAWQNYKEANILWYTGWGLFGGGLLTAAVTVPFAVGSSFGMSATAPDERDPKIVVANRALWTTFYIGCGVVAASIPCLAVGQVRRKAAIQSYKELDGESYLSCEQIKEYYKNSETLWKTGWGLFGTGLGLTIVGTLCCFNYSLGIRDKSGILEKTGYALVGVGSAATIVSIPCLAVGQTRRKTSRRLYDTKCPDQPVLTFNIQASNNGLGLAMQF